jgi:serine/threonine protein kinase
MEAGLVDDWSILPEEVEVCRRPDGTWWQLGTGGYGTVYKGLYHGIHPVAIKIIHHIEEDRHKDSFIREASLLKALRHKNVVQVLGASLDGPQGTALLVTELMELGDLWRALSAKDSTGDRIFSWYNRGAQCMMDVANGLHYLHTKRVVHFDLKSANILLSKAGTAKLADIGMARVLNKSYLSVISGLGTFAWSAPEVLAGKRCTEKADIYSWGVVLWEICTGEAPARGDMRSLQAPDDCPQQIVDLYEQCIAENPDDRPSATQVLEILNSLTQT